MKKIFSFLLACFCCLYGIAGTINVSTGTNGSGVYVAPPGADPNWKVTSAGGLPPATNATYVVPHFSGFWEPTPVAGTNAGWINPSSSISTQQPGIYTFERKFTIAPCTGRFTTDFTVTADDVLNSMELVSPTGVVINLPFTTTTGYHLSLPITYTQNCPTAGTWRLRAKVNYIDQLGGFLLSGYISYPDPNCCDTTCKLTVNVPQVNNTYYPCGATFNLTCDKSYTFNRKLTCNPNSCFVTSLKSATLKDPSNNTPTWAATFITAIGGGTLAIPAGVTPGTYVLTYYYGAGNNLKCDSCKIYLNISCTDCNCVLTTSLKSGTLSYTPKCGDTATFNCASTIVVGRSLNCGTQGYVHINDASVTDALGNTPSWVTPLFLTNLASGNLVVPTGISGVFALKYVWGRRCQPCDSCTYYIRIRCCNIQVDAGTDISSCCPTQTYFSPTVTGGTGPYIYQWTPIAGLSNPNIANPNCTIAGTYTLIVTDAQGCRGTDAINVDFPPNTPSCCKIGQKTVENNKAVAETNHSVDLKLMPNPVNGSTLVVEYAKKMVKAVSITIADMQGKQLISKPFAARSSNGTIKYSIDVQNLANGTYTLTILGDGNTISQKFVVAR